ncbi:hypothetical protein GCM10018980_20420 [Streptomyces capoamus]|uniref:Uncharacterized protein n=1 Tax=Streptomyces capoamus TaxID=68183 RepID=A0A919EUD7_9ACTN|nr:hypothetical protein GCM10010501_03440 [Streptomyces libani subsp. rufus]GHG43578.1 hypothetical protein GCM10018980_20420 [Streptomyces capoamus]
MTAVVGGEIGGLVTRSDEFGVSVQQNRGLDFSGVHVGEQRGDHPGPLPRRLPVLGGREQRHPLTARGGLLDDIAQHVVAAVPVHHDQRVHARTAQRRRDVRDDRVQRHGGDADGSRPVRVLVRAGDRHRGKEVHRVRGGDLPRHGAGDERVGGQRKERTVLFEAPHGKDGDLC